MGIFGNLLGKSTEPSSPVLSEENKETLPVLPVIKRAGQPGLLEVYTIPFVLTNGRETDLMIAFTQELDGQFYYLTKDDLNNPAIDNQFQQWKENIGNYKYDPYLPQSLNLMGDMQDRIVFAAGYDRSAEKILSGAFLNKLCDILKTDQIIVSIPRRGLLMATGYHEEFAMLENFFYTHQDGWQNNDDGGEPITEMVFVANRTGIIYAAGLDFRINLYEKDGQYKLSYSTTSELFGENAEIDFRAMLDRNNVEVATLPDAG